MTTQLLNTTQAASFLGLSKAFLERDRWAGAKVPFIKIGDRAVRYRIEDLQSYVQSRLRVSTSDTGVRK
ncbi:MAG TPA: helix-turn-helix domain-containing protein [Methylophilaceae bacterium]|jgi:predicted DNA-binding transcriptional regulator AlpA